MRFFPTTATCEMKWSAVLAFPSLLFISHLVCSQQEPLPSDCVWNRDTEFSTFPPVLMDKSTWLSILPTMNNGVRQIRIKQGTVVVIACPKAVILATGTIVTEGVCNGGGVLDVGDSAYTMMQLGCESRPKEDIQRNLGNCGLSNAGDLYAIGFAIPGYNFYQLISVCFDPVLQITLYVKHTVRGASRRASDENSSNQPSFKEDLGFYTVSCDRCYAKSAQDMLLENLLGYSTLVDSSLGKFMVPGHLAPNGDFFAQVEADATFYYINAVPEWQVVNNGNWKNIEDKTKDYAGILMKDFLIWTGTHGILGLPGRNNNEVEIYLGLTENKTVIPAPEIMWKVVYDPSSNRAVGFVTANNPYLTSFPAKLCTDVCGQLSWINTDFNQLSIGATYCCEVDDLRRAIPHVPNLGSVQLLT